MIIKKRLLIRLTCALVALLGSTVALLAAAKYTVTATICNQDPNNNAYTLQSDGSGSAVYSTGSGVDSEITPSASGAGTLYYQWSFDVARSSRSFYLTLSPVNGSPPGPFSGALAFNGQLYSRCFGANSSTYQNWTEIQFADPNCAMRVNFTFNGIGYGLVMSPAYPGTGAVTVTCARWNTSSNSCSAWAEVPTAGINAGVANLYGSGGSLVGQYYLSFNITITHP